MTQSAFSTGRDVRLVLFSTVEASEGRVCSAQWEAAKEVAQPNQTFLLQKLPLAVMVEESKSRKSLTVTTQVNMGAKNQPTSSHMGIRPMEK